MAFNSSKPWSRWSAKPGNAIFCTHKGFFFDFSENPSPESHRASHVGLGPGTSLSSGTHLLVVAVCACALHAQLQTTNVEINVYFPGGLLRSDSRVFLSSENNNEVRVISNDTQLKINVFGKHVYDLPLKPRFQEYSKLLVSSTQNSWKKKKKPALVMLQGMQWRPFLSPTLFFRF